MRWKITIKREIDWKLVRLIFSTLLVFVCTLMVIDFLKPAEIDVFKNPNWSDRVITDKQVRDVMFRMPNDSLVIYKDIGEGYWRSNRSIEFTLPTGETVYWSGDYFSLSYIVQDTVWVVR